MHQFKHGDVIIAGIAESDPQLIARYKRSYQLPDSLFYPDLNTLVDRTHPDAVLAYNAISEHLGVVEACAPKHIHVMVEKPLATTVKDATRIAALAAQYHIQVLVNYETTWYDTNQQIFEMVSQDAIGAPRKMIVHDGHEGPKEINVGPEFLGWLTDPKLTGGGALFDFGCYGADLMTYLMDGARPLTVTAVTQRIKPDIYPRVDDEATIILTYPKAQAILQASWNWPYSRKDMEVYGRTGSVITIANNDISVRLPHERVASTRAAAPIAAPNNDSLTYLRSVLLDGAKPDALSSLETNVIVSEILDAASRSASSGQTIRLPN